MLPLLGMDEALDEFELLMEAGVRAVRLLHTNEYLPRRAPESVVDFMTCVPKRARDLPWYVILDDVALALVQVTHTACDARERELRVRADRTRALA